jgi:hypothetical protein
MTYFNSLGFNPAAVSSKRINSGWVAKARVISNLFLSPMGRPLALLVSMMFEATELDSLRSQFLGFFDGVDTAEGRKGREDEEK